VQARRSYHVIDPMMTPAAALPATVPRRRRIHGNPAPSWPLLNPTYRWRRQYVGS